jgi:hypothetical protein
MQKFRVCNPCKRGLCSLYRRSNCPGRARSQDSYYRLLLP